MTNRYFLKAFWQTDWDKVTKDQFMHAEHMAGFWPKHGREGQPATGGFSNDLVAGRIEYEETFTETENGKE